MPFKKKRTFKKPVQRRGPSWLKWALPRLASVIKNFNTEKKTFDTSYSQPVSATTASTWDVNLITAIPKGDDYNQREGNSVKLMGRSNKTNYVINTATGHNYALIRDIVIRDKEVTNTGSPITNTYTNAAANVPFAIFQDSSNIESPFKNDVGKRYQILQDKFIKLDTTTPIIHAKSYHKDNHHIHYNNENSSSTGGYKEGQMYHIYGAYYDGASGPKVTSYDRLRFVDN